MDLAHVGDGLFRRADIGLRNDLEQRRARTVQVDARRLVETLVDRLAGIFLEVGARNSNALVVTIGVGDE